MNEQPSSNAATDEEQTVRLLRLAGPRPVVPEMRAARVREAVHTQWQVRNRRRVIRQRTLAATVLVAVAAALVLIVGRSVRSGRSETSIDTSAIVAVVERIDGRPRRATGDAGANALHTLALNDVVRAGDWIETDASARVALRFPDGTSLRLDLGSRARPLSPRALELASGAVYVDTGRASGRFEVRTAIATAHDIGTQFEVRLIYSSLRLRVRTGVVELRDGARSVAGRAGTEVTFSALEAMSRPISPYGSDWDWTASLAPPLEIEGVALATFLERLSQEHGWVVRYADPKLASDASGIVLHGSVTGLTVHEALEIATTTSGLRHRLENGELRVFRGPSVKKPL